jgi:hypothetical protein
LKEIQSLILQQPEAIVRAFFKDKDGRPLQLTSYQSDFVKSILSRKHNRIIYIAARQTGKSEAIACAISVLALLCPNERIINISYTKDQASIIFERVKAHLVDDSPELRERVDLSRSLGKTKEFSKTRMFMRNGTEIRVLSTGTGDTGETGKSGESLLGFEATILVVDEAGSIPDDVFQAKILPMLGAKRTIGLEKILILSGTPHNPGHFETSWNSPRYLKFHVDWRKGVQEGRLSESLVDEERENMTSTQFEMWYEAKFPSMTEDSMFDMAAVERNIVPEMLSFQGVRILSVDVARFGVDKTVYTLLDYADDVYRVVEILASEHKDTMQVTGKIMSLHNEFKFDRILIDETGLGGGPLDRLKELHAPAFGVVAGARPTTKDGEKNCINLKAELYAKAARLFAQNKLKITDKQELRRDLRLSKRDYLSSGKLRVIDPDKSPDYSDSLIYGLYVPTSGTFVVLDTSPSEKRPWE